MGDPTSTMRLACIRTNRAQGCVSMRRWRSTYDWRRDHAIFNARCEERLDGEPFSQRDDLNTVARASSSVSPMELLRLDVIGNVQVEVQTENQKCTDASFELLAPVGSTAGIDAEGLLSVTPNGRGGLEVQAVVDEVLEGALLQALIPEKFSLAVTTTGEGNVIVARLEGGASIRTQGGSISMDKVSEGPVELQSNGGDIECRVINCNAKVDSGDGSFSSKRMQGLEFDVSTGSGSVDVGAMYADVVKVESSSGPITVGSLHALTELKSDSGAIVVKSGADGELTVSTKTGHIDVQLGMSIDAVELGTQGGDVKISAPLQFAASRVELHGQRGVQVDSAFESKIEYDGLTAKGSIGDAPTSEIGRGYKPKLVRINASAAQGRVDLMTKGWLASLGLGIKE